MLSEKDCRQLSSAAQQGQDTSTRGVKGTQETPTHQAPAHPLLYLLSFPSFLNLATSPADHRPLTSPHVTSETFVCLPQLEDVPDSTWCWDWEAAAWWCGGWCVTRTNQTKPTWGAFEMRGKMTNSSSQYLTEMTKRIKTGIDIRQWALANGHLHNGYSSRHYTTAGPLHLQFQMRLKTSVLIRLRKVHSFQIDAIWFLLKLLKKCERFLKVCKIFASSPLQ